IFGARGVAAFKNDFIDESATGPFMTNVFGLRFDPDTNPNKLWPGGENIRRYFGHQDLFAPMNPFDPPTAAMNFTNRLSTVMNRKSTYDRSTFYRLLSALTTDSDPDWKRVTIQGLSYPKIHLNYANVGTNSPTNFISWGTMTPQFKGPEAFFT